MVLVLRLPCSRRYMPVQKVAWQDVKGTQVLVGSYEEAVKVRMLACRHEEQCAHS